MSKTIVIVISALVALLVAGWVGLQVQPRPFPAYPERPGTPRTVALPADLPAPVARYYRSIIGDQIPVVESAVVSGRGSLRVFGLRFPARFRFTHLAGQGYRHDIEATLFGYPLMKVNESYLNGQARMELPVGVTENEPKIDMAANLALWAESAFWLPSILVTDPRARWEAVDGTTARLLVPFGDGEDVFTVMFDPQTGLLDTMMAMRYREATDTTKTPWRSEVLGWGAFDGTTVPSPAALTWLDEQTPWSVWTVEELVYNVDVDATMLAAGR